MMLQHPSGIPIVDKDLPNVPGLLVLCTHVQTDCFCPTMQCLDHCKIVGQWVVGHKVEVAVHVGGFPVYSHRDGAIWVSLEQDIQKWELRFRCAQSCHFCHPPPTSCQASHNHSVPLCRELVILCPELQGLRWLYQTTSPHMRRVPRSRHPPW